jgi:hypothetical protein
MAAEAVALEAALVEVMAVMVEAITAAEAPVVAAEAIMAAVVVEVPTAAAVVAVVALTVEVAEAHTVEAEAHTADTTNLIAKEMARPGYSGGLFPFRNPQRYINSLPGLKISSFPAARAAAPDTTLSEPQCFINRSISLRAFVVSTWGILR